MKMENFLNYYNTVFTFVYSNIARIEEAGVKWVQIDEPS